MKNISIFICIGLLKLINSTCIAQNYTVTDFYKYDSFLEYLTDSIYSSLNDTQRVAQMIITSAGELGKPEKVVRKLAEENLIGGVVFLKNSRENHIKQVNELNRISKKNNTIGLLFSMDAEPSLFNGRIGGSQNIPKTIELQSKKLCDSITTIICNELNSIGIHQNYAPVVDISPQNAAIRNRSFGSNMESVIELSSVFVNTSQKNNIIATAKHFPGHGLVTGDTHEQSVYIDGELQELSAYPPLIKQGVISIMIAHVTVKNNINYNTNGLPASCSRRIVTDLLKDSLNFKGLVISDALGHMKAVNSVESPSLKASMAGCDLILMPKEESQTINLILNEMNNNDTYRQQVEQSVKKIVRLKICAGIIKFSGPVGM